MGSLKKEVGAARNFRLRSPADIPSRPFGNMFNTGFIPQEMMCHFLLLHDSTKRWTSRVCLPMYRKKQYTTDYTVFERRWTSDVYPIQHRTEVFLYIQLSKCESLRPVSKAAWTSVMKHNLTSNETQNDPLCLIVFDSFRPFGSYLTCMQSMVMGKDMTRVFIASWLSTGFSVDGCYRWPFITDQAAEQWL